MPRGLGYSWDAAGSPLVEQYAIQAEGSTKWTESARRSYGYDSLGRLTDDIVTTPDEQTQITATTYAYDLDDQLTWKETSGTAGAGEHVYGYDQAGRLSYWTHADTTTRYTWDASGNRTMAGEATAAYDARNRLLTDATATYRYTPRGTLSTITKGTTVRSLTFDAFERKITDGTSTYTYDSLDRLAQHGSTTFRYDGGSNNLLGDGTTDYTRTPSGSLLGSSNGATRQWSLTDRHTDLVAGLSTDGLQVTGSTAYGPFGTTTATEGDMPDLGYQSGWTDPANGNVNISARWYQPGTGTFASRDTWHLDPTPSGQANRYTYAEGDPLGNIDPTGHINVRDLGSGVGAYTGPIARGGARSGPRKLPTGRQGARSTGRSNRSAARAQARSIREAAHRVRDSRAGVGRGTTRTTSRSGTLTRVAPTAAPAPPRTVATTPPEAAAQSAPPWSGPLNHPHPRTRTAVSTRSLHLHDPRRNRASTSLGSNSGHSTARWSSTRKRSFKRHWESAVAITHRSP